MRHADSHKCMGRRLLSGKKTACKSKNYGMTIGGTLAAESRFSYRPFERTGGTGCPNKQLEWTGTA